MTAWRLLLTDLDPEDEGRREALCTLGNGYFATRGAAPESRADDVHYPGTYIAGCYNRLASTVAGRETVDESLINAPNWLYLTFHIDGDWFDISGAEVLDYTQELDIERGILLRRLRFRDHRGRTTRMAQRRIVHMESPHLAGLETTLVAENWSGTITFRSGIDGRVANRGVERYRALADQHLVEHQGFEAAPGTVAFHARTNQSGVRIAEASRTRIWLDDKEIHTGRSLVQDADQIAHDCAVPARVGSEIHIEKTVAIYTSRDHAISEPIIEAVDAVRTADRFENLLAAHVHAWSRLWSRFHLGLSTSQTTQRNVRLHLFHLVQTLSPHTLDLDVGIPARGLHGEAYRGHVFWDELFVLPTMTLRMPHLTRALLLYRYRRLHRARLAAREAGFAGAMFPWQSGSNGREESQRMHLNPQSGNWLPDLTFLQRHIGLAIAYNVRRYHQASGDDEFLALHGAEIILEITRFFASLAHYDRSHDRYVIRGVVGPDEYHTRYPGRDEHGIDNNAYTNIMTAWMCRTAVEVLSELPDARRHELTAALTLQHNEIDRWKRLAQRMFVPFTRGGIISQFEHYDTLIELDWDHYRQRYGDIQRLDRLLESEGDDVNRYQVSKQADVLMLFYLLSAEELINVLNGLEYAMLPETIPRTIDYYLQRTSHGSTLSAVVHGWVLARAHRERAVEFFDQALASDVHDTQHGTTREGIHLAAMVGSVDLLQRCFAGIEIRDDGLHVNPLWPPELGVLELPLRYRDHPITIRVTGRTATVRTAPGTLPQPLEVHYGTESTLLGAGQTVTFSLDHKARGRT